MSDSSKRQGRRGGSTSRRYASAPPRPEDARQRPRVGGTEIAAAIAVAAVAAALIVLAWMVTTRAIQDERAQTREAAERVIVGQAATMAQEVSHEVAVIDQSIAILQAAWKANSGTFDLNQWKKDMPALTAVSDDMFIADDKHIIRQDILPQAVGQGVGAAYISFPHGALEVLDSDGARSKDSIMVQPNGSGPIDLRQYLIYVLRPLDHPQGWLVGASYRTENLTKMFAEAALGYNSLVALVDTRRGQAQVVVGPGARRPKTDLANTTMFEVMSRSDAGSWQGISAIDGVERLHAFRHVPGRDMLVVVAASTATIMAPAELLVAGTRMLGIISGGVVLVIAGLFAWGFYSLRANRRRLREFTRDKTELERLRADVGTSVGRAQLQGARLQALLDHGSDGVALVDSGLRLVQWNRRFEHGIGVELKPGLPLDGLLREQAARGFFDARPDVEAAIAARVAALRTGEQGLVQPAPDGQPLMLRGLPIDEGGSMLLLTGLPAVEMASAAETALVAPTAPAEPAAPSPLEW